MILITCDKKCSSLPNDALLPEDAVVALIRREGSRRLKNQLTDSDRLDVCGEQATKGIAAP